jgi:predicted alpha/beta hydrolase family esterase
MKKAILLHGMPGKEEYYNLSKDQGSCAHWFPWLQKQLLAKDILTQTPEMPKPYEPNYSDWLKVFSQFEVDENTVLVGHSCGAGFLLRWLSENNVKVGKVVLVAPWIDPTKTLASGFFNFNLDKDLVNKTEGVTVFYSADDDQDILESVNILKEKVADIQFKEFHNYGHFCLGDMKTREFPELLEEALK